MATYLSSNVNLESALQMSWAMRSIYRDRRMDQNFCEGVLWIG